MLEAKGCDRKRTAKEMFSLIQEQQTGKYRGRVDSHNRSMEHFLLCRSKNNLDGYFSFLYSERPQEILDQFKGHLQTDGYTAYAKLQNKNIIGFYCMAHARRKIFDALTNDKARAEYVLAEMHKLYEIEEVCRIQQLSIEQIKEKRSKEALPILQGLGEWMKKEYEQLRPKTVIAQAFAYSIKRWDGLSLYATTGNLHIDNNAIERCMRTVAIGRKNYLFCGSHEAAKRAGRLYSLLVTCKLNDVNPYDWLKDVLSQNIQEIPINQIQELLPNNWKKNRQQTATNQTIA